MPNATEQVTTPNTTTPNTIRKITLKDFLVFKGEFECDFCPGINVIIGGNGTGKTTLLKAMYAVCSVSNDLDTPNKPLAKIITDNPDNPITFFDPTIPYEYNNFTTPSIPTPTQVSIRCSDDNTKRFKSFFSVCPGYGDCKIVYGNSKLGLGSTMILQQICNNSTPEAIGTTGYFWSETDKSEKINSVYIPESDMLSHSKGLPETYKYGNAQFAQQEIDIIERARVLPHTPEQPLYREICDLIQAEPESDGQNFFMKRYDMNDKIPFAAEASGYNKFGLLALLIRNEQIKPGTILFLDEPENSINPELIRQLVEILLKLSRIGVQIFITTHNELFANEFDVSGKETDKIKFISVYRTDDGTIKTATDTRFDGLTPNKLTAAVVEQYEREIEKGLGGND